MSNADILLLGDEEAAETIGRALNGRLTARDEPYEALLAMGQRRWNTVILSAPQSDFAGLVRAARRLQKDSRIFAVCPPAAESDVRPLVGDVLDDYFIYPPTEDDLAAIASIASRSQQPATAPAPAALSGRELAELIRAASAASNLESHLQQFIATLVGAGTSWLDADRADPAVKPLLIAAGENPRVLVPQVQLEPDAAVAATIAAIQDILPALFETARRSESLHKLAITDHLTGAYNRRYFYHVTDRMLARAKQEDFRVTLLLWDIDNFKRYNDEYGHAAGDEILRETAALMKRISRSHDVIARIGGDEFAALFWDADRPRSPDSQPLQTAYGLADRFRRAVSRHAFPSLGPEARGVLSISGGLASFPADGATCRQLLRKADEALKAAKSTGKNVILAGKQ